MLAVRFPRASPRICISLGSTMNVSVAATIVAHVIENRLMRNGVFVSPLARNTRESVGMLQVAGRLRTVQKKTVAVISAVWPESP